MARRWAVIVGLGLLAGCAGLGVSPGQRGDPVPAVHRGPAVLSVQLKSAVADPYYVLSGPTETYRAYRVTDRFRRHLEGYAARKSAAEGPAMELTVTLEALSTGYHQIGGVDDGGGRRRAGRAGAATVRVAAVGPMAGLGILGRLSGLEQDGNGLSIPYEITKRATLAAGVEVSSSGRTLARERVTAEAEQVIPWEEYDAWAYDYSMVFDKVFRQVLTEIDVIVDRAAEALGR